MGAAWVDGAPAGCCASGPLVNSDHLNACEMKRLFVRPAFRGFGLGRQLVERTMMQAQMAGYATMLLDTLSDMETARAPLPRSRLCRGGTLLSQPDSRAPTT